MLILIAKGCKVNKNIDSIIDISHILNLSTTDINIKMTEIKNESRIAGTNCFISIDSNVGKSAFYTIKNYCDFIVGFDDYNYMKKIVKEKVLDVCISKIDKKYSNARITYQNDDILKRGSFCDSDLKVISGSNFEFFGADSWLYIRGSYNWVDDKPIVIENKLVDELLSRVDEVNNKYGICKKWRAERGEEYYFISTLGTVVTGTDTGFDYDDIRFRMCNYFRTKEDAKKSPIYKSFRELSENGDE